MRLRDGQPVCDLCGARLGIPVYAKPEPQLRGTRGQRTRVLVLDGEVIHTCEITTRR